MSDYTLTFSELRDKFLKAWNGDCSFISSANRREYEKLRAEWKTSPGFYGGDPNDTVRWLRDGYTLAGLDGIDTSVIPAKKRARPRFSDDSGDFRYDLFSSGDDRYFQEWSRREISPAITVEFSTGFLGGMKAQTITDYFRWICQALIALEQAGMDSAIYVTNSGTNRVRGLSGIQTYRIEVKREGERCNYLNWSALFSPASYRQIGFFTFILQADKNGNIPGDGFGAPKFEGWNVRWDGENKILRITHEGRSDREGFPEREMTEKLISALAEARGN